MAIDGVLFDPNPQHLSHIYKRLRGRIAEALPTVPFQGKLSRYLPRIPVNRRMKTALAKVGLRKRKRNKGDFGSCGGVRCAGS